MIQNRSPLSSIRVCCIDEEGRFGGPERRITEIAKALKIHGIDTHVVYPIYDSKKFCRELSRAGVASSAVNITRLSSERRFLVKYVALFFVEVLRLCFLFRRKRADLVQVNGSQQFKAALAASIAGIPVVWVIEDTLMNPVVKTICTVLAKFTASGLIVTGKRVYEYYIRKSFLRSKPCIEIHPPVDTTVFDPEGVFKDKRICRIRGKKIVTVTGINPTKGIEYFMEMASILLKRHKDLYFFIAAAKFESQRKYYQYLKKTALSYNLTEKHFQFSGMVEDVPAFLKSADIFVFTSISESGPMAVWEAMSMGKPVVTTDVGAVKQYMEDGKSGFIVPVKDSRALSRKVEELLENPDLGSKMGLAARTVAQKKLDVSIAAEKYASFYRRILSLSAD